VLTENVKEWTLLKKLTCDKKLTHMGKLCEAGVPVNPLNCGSPVI